MRGEPFDSETILIYNATLKEKVYPIKFCIVGCHERSIKRRFFSQQFPTLTVFKVLIAEGFMC